jgi:hypothetical protein
MSRFAALSDEKPKKKAKAPAAAPERRDNNRGDNRARGRGRGGRRDDGGDRRLASGEYRQPRHQVALVCRCRLAVARALPHFDTC